MTLGCYRSFMRCKNVLTALVSGHPKTCFCFSSTRTMKITTQTAPILVAIIGLASAILTLISSWKVVFPSPQTITPGTSASEPITGSKHQTDREFATPNPVSRTPKAAPTKSSIPTPSRSASLHNNHSKRPSSDDIPEAPAKPRVSIGNDNVAPTIINGSGNNVINSIGVN